jgi:hypothetical protein
MTEILSVRWGGGLTHYSFMSCQIVPKMTEAFGDTHPKVREAGKRALGDIGNVIRNPEIRSLSPLLLQVRVKR